LNSRKHCEGRAQLLLGKHNGSLCSPVFVPYLGHNSLVKHKVNYCGIDSKLMDRNITRELAKANKLL
jgi:hypothetical protein